MKKEVKEKPILWLNTSKVWYNLTHTQWEILDADGWDRSNWDFSWDKELITYEEFVRRFNQSTVCKNRNSS